MMKDKGKETEKFCKEVKKLKKGLQGSKIQNKEEIIILKNANIRREI